MPKQPLFLVGMMGAGKSTVGRRVAQDAGASFVDLDRRIERVFGRTVQELFAEGEDVFRTRERAALETLVREPGMSRRALVVATGGGVVLDADNRKLMRGHGAVVFLDVPVPVLVSRLSGDATRPLLRGADDLEARLGALLEARRQAYEDTGVRLEAGGDADTVARAVRAIWEAA